MYIQGVVKLNVKKKNIIIYKFEMVKIKNIILQYSIGIL